MKDNGKWRVKKCAEKRRRKDVLGLRLEGRGWVDEWERKEGGEDGGGKEKAKRGRWVGGWWGYDELKMTLSGSLVSKDHSVC